MMSSRNIAAIIGISAVIVIIAAYAFMIPQNDDQDNLDLNNVDQPVVEPGDKVTVDYIGTLYNSFGKENAVVFDTSKEEIGTDPSIEKSLTYSRTTYDTFEFVVDSGTTISGFNESVKGHKVGDVVKVYLKTEDAYNYPSYNGSLNRKDVEINKTNSISLESFKTYYPEANLSNGKIELDNDSGLPMTATLGDNDDVLIEYVPLVGSKYELAKSGDTSIVMVVKSVDDERITYDVDIVDPVYLEGNSIKMVKIELTYPFFITEIYDDNFFGHYMNEVFNQPLYFEIEIKSIEKAE